MPVIVSTASQDTAFNLYTAPVGDGMQALAVVKSVVIAGGAGLPNAFGMVKSAAETEISAADYDAIKDLPSFTRRVKRGFYQVVKSKGEAEKAAADMDEKDGSSMIEAGDLVDAENQGLTGKVMPRGRRR